MDVELKNMSGLRRLLSNWVILVVLRNYHVTIDTWHITYPFLRKLKYKILIANCNLYSSSVLFHGDACMLELKHDRPCRGMSVAWTS